MKTKKLGMKALLVMLSLIPLLLAAVILSVISITDISKEVKDGVYDQLETAAEQVNEYFIYDVENNGDVDYTEYSDHKYIESLKPLDVDLTLFKGDTRLITSVKNADGSYNEGTQASAAVWAEVSAGKTFTADDVVINGVDYYVCYVPIKDSTGKVWGMGFAGKPQSDVKAVIRKAVVKSVAVAAILVIACAVLAVAVAIKISAGISFAVKALETLADGRIDADTETDTMVNEVAEILNATTALRDALSSSIGGVKGKSSSLGGAVENAVGMIDNTVDATNQISLSVGELATTAQTMAESVQDANAAVIEMGDSIEQIASAAAQSADYAKTMATLNAETSKLVVAVSDSNAKSVESMQNISTLTKQCNEAVVKIEEAAGMISSIAGQTSLLALNASIEAARAGEAGRGFSVVAENIKDLATQSADSAQEIGGLVKDIVDKVDQCVKASKEATDVMNEQSDLVSEVTDKVTELSEAVDTVASNVDIIAASAGDLDTSKDAVMNSISDLSAISEENAASAEEVTASVESISSNMQGTKEETANMSALRDELESEVSFFKL